MRRKLEDEVVLRKQIRLALQAGKGIREIARELKCSTTTVLAVKKRIAKIVQPTDSSVKSQ